MLLTASDLETGLYLALANAEVGQYYRQLISRKTGYVPALTPEKDSVRLLINDPVVSDRLKHTAADILLVSSEAHGKIKLLCSGECCLNAMIRTCFIICGSISEPKKSYHLEFSLRRHLWAVLVSTVLENLDINALTLERKGHYIVYIQEGQNIADFLLLSGAHKAFMDFELLRVEKEMRNTVNRVVNCDSANTQRVADASARQLQLIKQIRDTTGLGILPQHLQETARARLEYPDLSLKELGESLSPPIGKSGINHRLKKIELLAHQLDKSRTKDQNHEN